MKTRMTTSGVGETRILLARCLWEETQCDVCVLEQIGGNNCESSPEEVLRMIVSSIFRTFFSFSEIK